MSSVRRRSGRDRAAFPRWCGSFSSSRFHWPPRRRFSRSSSSISTGSVTPARVAALGEPALLSLGFTRQKARYVAGLAGQLESGAVSLERIARLPDAGGLPVARADSRHRPVDRGRLPVDGVATSGRLATGRPRPAQIDGGGARIERRADERRGCRFRRALEPLARRCRATAVALVPVAPIEGLGSAASVARTVAGRYLIPSNRNAVRPCGRWIGSTRSSRSTGE